jgi:hypothetical protein
VRAAARLLPALLALAPVAGCASSAHDFDAVVSAVQARYPAHVQRVPLMGLVSFCARVVTGDGVKGMRIAELENFRKAPDPEQLEHLVSDTLGSGWQRFVTERQHNGEVSMIFSQPDGRAMRLMIADYENGELDLVGIEVDGKRMQRWLQNPQGSARDRDYGKRAVAD